MKYSVLGLDIIFSSDRILAIYLKTEIQVLGTWI